MSRLRSVAHNIADSLASGVSLLIGFKWTEIFIEARQAPGGVLTVDFLAGIIDGPASAELVEAVRLYAMALPGLCTRSGVDVASYRMLEARYASDGSVIVTIETARGQRSSSTYRAPSPEIGSPLRKLRRRRNG